jgi:hypothetical protein
MLFGIITHDNLGTRVRGRAGSDLNGVVMFSLLVPLVVFLTAKMVSDGSTSPRQLFIVGLIFLVGGPLIYWSAHKDRRSAEPLIRFLDDALSAEGEALRKKSRKTDVLPGLTLNISGEEQAGSVTPDSIHDALIGLGEHDFVVVASGPETYIQTAFRDGGYILEMRDGDGTRHFSAARPGMTAAASVPCIFSFDETREAFMAWASGIAKPHLLLWQPLHVAV